MDKAPLSQEEIDALLAAAQAEERSNETIDQSDHDKPKAVTQPVEFEMMNPETGQGGKIPEGLSLILDVPMEVTVELGRARKLVREILSMTPGSVVELDRHAGEPVDILVNGKLLARGEVVVIDENFGVRISEIVSKSERLSGIK